MPGSHNFQVFNPTASGNTDSDSTYLAKTQRIEGLTSGMSDSSLHNKLFRQVSVMATALAQFMANQGQTVSDADVNALTTAVTNTFAVKGVQTPQFMLPSTWSQ